MFRERLTRKPDKADKSVNHLAGCRLFLCLLFFLPLPAYSKTLVIVMSERHHVYQDLVNSLQTERLTVNNTVTLDEFERHKTPLADITLAIGTRACEAALKTTGYSNDIVCTFLPSQTFLQLVEQNQINNTLATRRVTAIFMDQPLQRQIHLAKLIAPDAQSIGTLFSTNSVYQQPAFESLSHALGLEAHHAFLDERQNPVQVLTPLIQNSDVFLSLPDSASFNRNVTRWALYISLRNRIPLIGFSASYTEAGAVISLYTTTEQLAQQTSQVLSQLSLTDDMPTPAFPKEFTLSINPSAARTLRLELPSIESLTKQLTEAYP